LYKLEKQERIAMGNNTKDIENKRKIKLSPGPEETSTKVLLSSEVTDATPIKFGDRIGEHEKVWCRSQMAYWESPDGHATVVCTNNKCGDRSVLLPAGTIANYGDLGREAEIAVKKAEEEHKKEAR